MADKSKLKMTALLTAAAVFALAAIFSVLMGREKQSPAPGAEAMADGTKRVYAVMYHGLLKDKKKLGRYIISPREFENDLKYLKKNGYTTVTVSDLINYVYGDANLPDKAVMLTFDDGYYNNYKYAYPLLKKYDMKAVISIIGLSTDQFSEFDANNVYYSHLTWDQISEMSRSGAVEIQNHSYNLHADRGKRKGSGMVSGESTDHYREILMDDLGLLQTKFRENSGVESKAYVYPYGYYNDWSEETIREMGFLASLSCTEGVNFIRKGDPKCLYLLCRNLRPSGISSGKFFAGVFK